MLYRTLADAVLVVHLVFIVFVVAGAGLVLRWPRLVWLHLPAAAWGTLIELAGWVCPLTPLESRLRALGGEAGYQLSFIERYLLPVIYPGALTRDLQIVLGVAVLLVNAAAYGWIGIRRRRQA